MIKKFNPSFTILNEKIDDNEIADMLKKIDDTVTRLRCTAERAVMKKLEGGCSVPLAVTTTYSEVTNFTLIKYIWINYLSKQFFLKF